LWRSMIDFVLKQSRVERYRHAARHSAECASLASAIGDFAGFEPHERYIVRLKGGHGRNFFLDAGFLSPDRTHRMTGPVGSGRSTLIGYLAASVSLWLVKRKTDDGGVGDNRVGHSYATAAVAPGAVLKTAAMVCFACVLTGRGLRHGRFRKYVAAAALQSRITWAPARSWSDISLLLRF
jgi:hypothetical protein